METELNITPEQALAHFIETHKGDNRHQRRMFKKMLGIKLPTTNVPDKKEICRK